MVNPSNQALHKEHLTDIEISSADVCNPKNVPPPLHKPSANICRRDKKHVTTPPQVGYHKTMSHTLLKQ